MKYKFLIIVIIAGIFSSCDFLEYERLSDLTETHVFTQHENAGQIVTNIYAGLPAGFNYINNAMLASAGDEAEHAYDFSSIQNFNAGTWNKYSNPDDVWSKNYELIRKVNLFLEKTRNLDSLLIDEYKYVAPETYYKHQWDLNFYRAEVHFLRAFFYFELMKRYGEIPMINRTLTINESLDIPKSSIEDVVKAISNDCNYAANVLLPTWRGKRINNEGKLVSSGGMDMSSKTGRATKAASYALLAKTYLYAASPLHNNGNYNKAYCDSAAKYSALVMDMTDYALESNYANLFKTGTTYSKELIFERRSGDSNVFERYNFPVGYDEGGQGATCPSQNLAEAYEMKDGTQFDWSNPLHAAAPFANRDPRFDATFLCNNQVFQGRAVECWDDGRDGLKRERGTKTGYYLRKFVDPALSLRENKTSRHTWYFMRLADVYLMFAEAANEVTLNPTATLYGYSAAERLNRVRTRAGIPTYDNTDPNDFRQKVRDERRVELAFEDTRHWDVRRWNIGVETFGAPLKGLNIQKNEDGTFSYSVKTVENRVYANYMNLYPIPENEIVKTSLKQNPGWDNK